MRINYQSDFKIIEKKNLNGDVNTPLPSSLIVQSCRDVLLRSLTGTGTRTAVGLISGSLFGHFSTGMDLVASRHSVGQTRILSF